MSATDDAVASSVNSLSEIKRINEENNDLRTENHKLKEQIRIQHMTIQEQKERISELEEAVKQTSFVSASKVPTTLQANPSVDLAKYRSLLQVKTVEVTVSQTGEYLIYSDPVGRKLELRKKHVIP